MQNFVLLAQKELSKDHIQTYIHADANNGANCNTKSHLPNDTSTISNDGKNIPEDVRRGPLDGVQSVDVEPLENNAMWKTKPYMMKAVTRN